MVTRLMCLIYDFSSLVETRESDRRRLLTLMLGVNARMSRFLVTHEQAIKSTWAGNLPLPR